jgi:hypothetical protein
MFGLETMRHPLQGTGVEVGLGVGVGDPLPTVEAPHAAMVNARPRSRAVPMWSQRLGDCPIGGLVGSVCGDIRMTSCCHAHARQAARGASLSRQLSGGRASSADCELTPLARAASSSWDGVGALPAGVSVRAGPHIYSTVRRDTVTRRSRSGGASGSSRRSRQRQAAWCIQPTERTPHHRRPRGAGKAAGASWLSWCNAPHASGRR